MLRNVLAVLAAFFVGGLCVFAVEMIGHRVYPLPEGVDPNDMKQIADYIKTAPPGSILFVLLAQSTGSFVGGVVTGLISRVNKTTTAIFYGVLGLIMAGLNLALIPHPLWFAVLSILLPIPLAILGSRLASKSVSSESNATPEAADGH